MDSLNTMDRKLDFIICGAQKAGTTALAQYLSLHPDIYIPITKEIHFFDDEQKDWSSPDYREYHVPFLQANKSKLWGEATPIYMYWDPSPLRIWNYNKNIKVIIILRNPITRSYSHWSMEHNRKWESLDFNQAIKLEFDRSRENLPFQHRIYSYIDRGFYCNQIRRLWHLFGKDSVLILRQEELINIHKDCLNKIFDFLRVTPLNNINKIVSHKGSYNKGMTDDIKHFLKSVFFHEIKHLENMLEWNCDDWLEI